MNNKRRRLLWCSSIACNRSILREWNGQTVTLSKKIQTQKQLLSPQSTFPTLLTILFLFIPSIYNGWLAWQREASFKHWFQPARSILDAKSRVKRNCVKRPRNCRLFLRRALHHCRLDKKKILTGELEVDAFIGKLKFLLRNTYYKNNQHSSANWWYFDL